MKEPMCPSCEAELCLSGEEEDGDCVFCPYCGNELRLKRVQIRSQLPSTA